MPLRAGIGRTRRVQGILMVLVALAILPVAACGSRETPLGVTTAVPTPVPAITATAATATATPASTDATAAASNAPDWTVVRMEHFLAPERFRLTLILGGKERTLDVSRLCYGVAKPGEVLPETAASPAGYDVDCHVNN